MCSESPPSFRLGYRKICDSNRAVNGAQSRPEQGVITITIMIMIMITIMMRKHPYNLPAPATDRLRIRFVSRLSGGPEKGRLLIRWGKLKPKGN